MTRFGAVVGLCLIAGKYLIDQESVSRFWLTIPPILLLAVSVAVIMMDRRYELLAMNAAEIGKKLEEKIAFGVALELDTNAGFYHYQVANRPFFTFSRIVRSVYILFLIASIFGLVAVICA